MLFHDESVNMTKITSLRNLRVLNVANNAYIYFKKKSLDLYNMCIISDIKKMLL